MAISIQSSYTVTPSNPTPNPKLFSLCEQIKLRTHAPLLYVYKNPQQQQQQQQHKPPSTFFNHALHTLRLSLSKALSIYYPLAGRLSWVEGATSTWELNCNAKGALLLEAKSTITCLDELGGDSFVPTGLVSQLIPNIDYGALPIEDTPLLAVQLTGFPCGGVTIGVALCRAAIDGTATMRFMNAWAKIARGVPLDPSTEFPCHDRTVLDSRRLLGSRYNHDHSEFCNPPPWLGGLGRDARGVAVELVKLNREQVKKLKAKANIASESDAHQHPITRRPHSTFEVVAAHLWRCVTKARSHGHDDVARNGYNQPTRLSTLVNCRSRLRPPLPVSYAGNAAFPTVTPTCTSGDLIHKPLSFAAGRVRVALERVSEEFVRSALDYIAGVKDMDSVRYNFHYPAESVLEDGEGRDYKGNPNLFVVSWMNFSFKDADFGWGEAVYFGPGYMDSEGKAFVLNKADGDGLLVAICLEARHMDAFKKLFYEDVQQEVFPTSRL